MAAVVLANSACSAAWPTVVRSSPDEPMFRSGFPLVGDARTDGALCSLATVGPDATRLVSPPGPLEGAVTPEDACREALPAAPGQRGRVGRLVRVPTADGPFHGYLFATPGATGVVVAFSGLGMPPAGWVNQAFAEVGARCGLVTLAPVRDESARPIYFDPLREARRAVAAVAEVRTACRVRAAATVGFVGVSLGGLEALLATREALRLGIASRGIVLDPLLDPVLVAATLDGFWHSMATDAMQAYFKRILRGRYGEPASTSFGEVLSRVGAHADASTDLARDAPSAWLCDAERDAYVVYLSDTDPVLGDAQREFASSCGLPLLGARAPGHVPLACRPEIIEEMIEQIPGHGGEHANGMRFVRARIGRASPVEETRSSDAP